jgi:hypothetical protein
MSFGTFELYEIPRWPVPYPQNLLGIYSSREELIRDFHFTHSELEALLDGEVVREKYVLEMLPEVMQNLVREDLLTKYGKRELTAAEIAFELDMSVSAVKQIIHRFKVKQQGNRKFQMSLHALVEHRRSREYSSETKSSIKHVSY